MIFIFYFSFLLLLFKIYKQLDIASDCLPTMLRQAVHLKSYYEFENLLQLPWENENWNGILSVDVITCVYVDEDIAIYKKF